MALKSHYKRLQERASPTLCAMGHCMAVTDIGWAPFPIPDSFHLRNGLILGGLA